MEEFKIDLFKKEYNVTFPAFVHLTEITCANLVERISSKYFLSSDSLVDELNLKQFFLKDKYVEDDFSLIDTLNHLSINSLSKIYINWHRFNDIDQFNLIDLDKYFHDIWFPSADDIDLFDDSLDWIVSIRHDGCISYIKSTNNPDCSNM